MILQLAVTGNKDKFDECEHFCQSNLSDLQNAHNRLSLQLSYLERMSLISEMQLCIGFMNFFLNRKFKALFSFKSSYTTLIQIKRQMKLNADNLDEPTKNRILFLEGLFNIGMSLIPHIFIQLLQFIGFKFDTQLGISLLSDCIQQNSVRSNYAAITLAMYQLEVRQNIELAQKIISGQFGCTPAPISFWIQSHILWKNSQSERAIKMLEKSLQICLANNQPAEFINLELLWIQIAQMKWAKSYRGFQECILQCCDLKVLLANDFQSFCLQRIKEDIDFSAESTFFHFLGTIQQKNGNQIYFPHKTTLVLVTAITCIHTQEEQSVNLWLCASQQIHHQIPKDRRSNLDNEMYQLSKAYLKRRCKFLL